MLGIELLEAIKKETERLNSIHRDIALLFEQHEERISKLEKEMNNASCKIRKHEQ